MKSLDISPDFTIEDIHKIREYNYEMAKNMTRQEKMDYYNERGRKVQCLLEEKKSKTYSEKAYQLAMNNTKYNQEGKAVVELDDEWREETEWEIFDMQDEGVELPAPYSKGYNKQDTDIVTLVDVDFAEYRKSKNPDSQ